MLYLDSKMMDMKIEIEQPIALRLEVVETDAHVPSMRVSAKIVVTQFQHVFTYDGTFWIECASWDVFTQSLLAPLSEEIALSDMSGYFMLVLRKTNDGLSLIWKYAKADVGSNGRRLEIAFTSAIDDDMLAKIRDEFREFPVWW
jgi:hypothetical protein